MVRILINDIDVGVYVADEIGFSATWQAKLIDTVNKFAIVSLKTVRLPYTKILKTIFKDPTDIDSKGSVSVKEYFTIKFIVNDNLPINGYVKPIKTVILNNDEYIELATSPKDKTWIDEFKALKLNTIDYSDQDHELTVANIRASETFSSSRPYVYAPIDIGEITRLPVLWVDISGTNWDYYYLGEQVVSGIDFTATSYGFSNSSLWQNFETFKDVASATWNTKNIFLARHIAPVTISTKTYDQFGYLYVEGFNWQVGDFYPCIKIRDILERAFDSIGYQVEIEGDFMDDKYHYWHNVEALNKYESERTYFKTKVLGDGSTGGGYVISTSGFPKTYTIPFMNTSIDGFKSNVNFNDIDSDSQTDVENNTNNSKFTAVETTVVAFVWKYRIKVEVVGFPLANHVYYLAIAHYNSSNTLIRNIVYELKYYSIYNTDSSITFEGEYKTGFSYMEVGDYVKCEFFVSVGGFPDTVNVTIYDSNTFESVMFAGGNFRGKEIHLNEYLPESYAYDWIKDLSLIHNLEFYTNEVLKKVYIVAGNNKRTGKIIDYTQKLNRTREVEIEEVATLHPKKYIFNWDKDPNDWAVDVVEQVLEDRFAKGEITNDNLFVTEETNVDMSVYSASLDKFEINSPVTFNTVEMKGKSTYPSLPTYKRVDYKPRYLTLTFGETLEDNGLPFDGGTASPIYSIEGDGNPLTYVRAEFQTPLHYSSLIDTYYKTVVQQINNGWIIRAYFYVNENDVDSVGNIRSAENDFRADYRILLKGNERQAELVKIIDYNPDNKSDTRIEFVILKDLI